jgi:type II secretory pathway pseudopilin PulG
MFRKRAQRDRGFTLIEAALATIIVGVGIVSTMTLFAACSQQALGANQMTTAMMLANNVHEAAVGLPFADPTFQHKYFGPEPGETLATFNDIDDWDGSSFNPPIDAQRNRIANLSQYTQVVSVWPVYPNKLSANSTADTAKTPDIPKTTYTGGLRMRVRIMFQAKATDRAVQVYEASWICMDD